MVPPGDSENERLRRCIRDLAALNALPSLCIGRTPRETVDTLADALPTVLDCDLVYFLLPGNPAIESATLDRMVTTPAQLDTIRQLTCADTDGADATLFVEGQRMWCLEAEVPFGTQRGRLLAARARPFDPETDRVLIRTAANLIGTIAENARVLDVARHKDDFLAMLGHELRNPLAPIVTAIDLLKLNPSVTRERDVIERHTQHMVRIVDDLLDISRVTRGQIEFRREQVLLSSILQRAVEIVSPLITRNRHTLEVTDGVDATLQGDPIRLAQIFGNLLTNAAKFTPAGGRIDVEVDKSADRVRVVIRDSGVGIAPDQLQRIFEPFVQADRARDSLRGGLGLGLAIAHSLVERHGGTISVDSRGRGQGAAFTVELPITAPVRTTPPQPVPQPTESRAAFRVLVVDDDTDIADLVGEALRGHGFQIVTANNGRGALTEWRRFSPHAGVLDVGLPDLDGYELARTIRNEHGADSVLIAVTGYGQATDRELAARAGFDIHLVKPVSIGELVKVLDQRVVRGKS